MTLSKSAIRPAQTRFLLAHGILPISLDHRLCPEINLIDGPMSDVRDAVSWARSTLPSITLQYNVTVNPETIAVIGWSTGGHLAMTTAWTTTNAGIPPPTAILNFYGPSDMETLGKSYSPLFSPSTQQLYTNNNLNSLKQKPRKGIPTPHNAHAHHPLPPIENPHHKPRPQRQHPTGLAQTRGPPLRARAVPLPGKRQP